MSNFQVGDRVSVEGVVVDPYSGHLTCIQFDYGDEVDVATSHVTLVERPRRKLRVGSVYCHTEAKRETRYLYMGNDFFMDLRRGEEVPRHELLLEKPGHEDSWREVPVEELEREAE